MSADSGSSSEPIPNPPDAPGAVSHPLLVQVRSQLAGFEAELCSRERRLSRLQQELQEAQLALRQERATRSEARELIEREFAGQLRQAETRIQAQAEAVREQEQTVASLMKAEEKLKAELQALQSERRRLAARLEQAEHEAVEQRAQRARLEELLSASTRASESQPEATTPQSAEAGMARAPAPRAVVLDARRQRILRISVAVAGVCVLLGLIGFLRVRPAYRVDAFVAATPQDVDVLAECASIVPVLARAEGAGAVHADLSPTDALLHVYADSDAADIGTRAVDAAIRAALAQVTSRPSASPDLIQERRSLSERLRELDHQLSASAAAPTSAPAGSELSEWAQLQAARRGVIQSLDGAEVLLRQTQPADVAEVEPAHVDAALRTDPKLQADTQILRQREEALAKIMEASMARGLAALETFAGAIATGDKRIRTHLEEADGEVIGIINRISAALDDWHKSVSALDEVWQRQRAAASQPAGDALAAHAAIEPAVHRFVDETAAAHTRLNQALESLGQGGDQPTKRLVLRNAVTRELQDALDAREAAVASVRMLLPAGNVELAAAIQRVSGLRTQLEQQRSRIAAELARRAGADRRAQHERAVTQAKTDRERLLREKDDLDRRIIARADQAMDVLAQLGTEREAITQQVGLYREHARVLARLSALDEQIAGTSRVPFHYVPARATELPISLGKRLNRALLAGGLPALACVLGALGVWLFTSWRASRREVAEYTRMLETARSGSRSPVRPVRNKA